MGETAPLSVNVAAGAGSGRLPQWAQARGIGRKPTFHPSAQMVEDKRLSISLAHGGNDYVE